MPCRKCLTRGKDWSGDDPKCAYDGDFPDNWNCATMNELRRAIDDIVDSPGMAPDWFSYTWCEDQNYAHIVAEKGEWGDNVFRQAPAFWVTWYKRRGCTEQIWVMSDENDPRRPTEAEIVALTDLLKRSIE